MNNIYLLTAIIIFITSCSSQSTKIDDFTSYKFSMENTNNFKIEFQLDSDSTFKIIQYNYFFDNFEKRKKPIETKGKLNDDEFSKITKLLQESDIKNKKESYGFKEENMSYSDIIYIIELQTDTNTQFVSIHTSETISIPTDFAELIQYTNQIISSKHTRQLYN